MKNNFYPINKLRDGVITLDDNNQWLLDQMMKLKNISNYRRSVKCKDVTVVQKASQKPDSVNSMIPRGSRIIDTPCPLHPAKSRLRQNLNKQRRSSVPTIIKKKCRA